MGSSIRVLTDERANGHAVSSAAGAIRRTFEREERRFSRFRADSELSRVNAADGRSIRVSTPFASVTRLALDAAASTGGLFDPTVLGAMEAIGYDRDFDEVLAGARGMLQPTDPCGRWRDVRLHDDVLRLPGGVGLDLGGLAKGWTADLAAERALDAGLPWVATYASRATHPGSPSPSRIRRIVTPRSAASRSTRAASPRRRCGRDRGALRSTT
jgi:thiamine biosynthesis lipoprotein